MGLTGYGARRFAANFTADEFCRALDDAHRIGAAVNLTLNTVMSDAEIDAVESEMARLYEAGLDGVIVQDWGAVRWLAATFPSLPIHGSTQMALANGREVRFGAKTGLSRVVLPRELSFDEIALLRETTKMELEVFCSGALCLACSGKCYLSSFVGGRSGNRGSCAQPCRQRYRQIAPSDPQRPAEGYLLSLKDQLHHEEDIRRLAHIGVDVVKIEGRMKSPSYVYEAVRYYRRIIDRIDGIPPEISRKMFFVKEEAGNRSTIKEDSDADAPVSTELPRLFNRGYGGGFLADHDPEILNPLYASHYGFPIGEIRRGKIVLSDAVAFGDGVVYLDEKLRKIDGTNVSEIRLQPTLYGEKERRVSEAKAGEIILLDAPPPADARHLYKTFDQRLQKETTNRIKQTRRHRPIEVKLTAKIGRPLELTLIPIDLSGKKTNDAETEDDNGIHNVNLPKETRPIFVRVVSDPPLEKSLKQKNDRDSLIRALDRFGGSPFFLQNADLDFDPDVFIPKSLLNGLRQEAVQKTEDAILASFRREMKRERGRSDFVSERSPSQGETAAESNGNPLPPTELAAVVRTRAQGLAAFKAGIWKIYLLRPPVRFEENAQDWLRRQSEPTRHEGNNSFTATERKKTVKNKEDSVSPPFVPVPLAGNLLEAIYYEENGIPFAADSTFNVGNLPAARFLLDRFRRLQTLYLSTELGKETVVRLHQSLAPVMARRGGRVGLSVYGHPIGMFTRKTLFTRSAVELENQDGRRFVVLQNRDAFCEEISDAGDSGENDRNAKDPNAKNGVVKNGDAKDRDALTMTGSSVFYAPPNDILDEVTPLLRDGGWEFRFDLTLETPDEIVRSVGRFLSSQSKNDESSSRNRPPTGYGFSHPIF